MARKTENDTEKTEQDLKRQAYQAAESRLRKAHTDEFEQYREEECKARGVEYTRRLTAREKAERTLAALRAEFPDLTA